MAERNLTKTHDNPDAKQTELIRMKYCHIENLAAFVLVGVITVGGFVCVFERIQCGQTIVVGVLGLMTGWIGRGRANRRQ